ncbi:MULTISPECIES: glycosyltransferase [unclassified Clostridium]|uniref:glycosyltransferase n=1 Tax=unclassified Clostridium TaxID=2614128 RepID=UPI0011071B9B|nr:MULTISPECIES: glycosyltransferase [unclassified Clostridium]
MSFNEELLSVIIPVYNVETYLKACINSIINQTYRNIEIILVDDGSTDMCPQICDEYKMLDSRVKVIHKKNGGQGSARNMGINIATGKYVAFCDSDDFIEPNMYESLITSLVNTNSEMAICGFITHSGIRVVNSKIPGKNYVWGSTKDIIREYFNSAYITGSPCNKVFLRHIFKEVRFPEGVAREDVYIMHHVFDKCNRAVHVGECLYHYNIREGSNEHQLFHPKYLISLEIADERCNFIKNSYPELLPLAQKSCYGARISAIKKITRSHMIKEYSEIYNRLIDYLKKNEAPTRNYQRIRFFILYLPFIYKIEMDYKYYWRKKIKKIILRLKNNEV